MGGREIACKIDGERDRERAGGRESGRMMKTDRERERARAEEGESSRSR